MTYFEKLVHDYDELEFDYDPFGYRDAFSDREEARESVRTALVNKAHRRVIIDRLLEIADDDEYKGTALELLQRVIEVERRTA